MANKNPSSSITFHYIKSNEFRVIHADGVWGGATPRSYITMSFYSERVPIPQTITHEVKEGILGSEQNRSSKDGIIREVEVEVMIDLVMAKSLIPWLQEKIDQLENRNQSEGVN